MYKNTHPVTEEIADHIFHQINLESMLLSNIYAAIGKWEEFAKVMISEKRKGQGNLELVYESFMSWRFIWNVRDIYTIYPNGSINLQNLVGRELNVNDEVQ
ncbi:hypothetical protein G4B88_022350 [Cannabis sativa]|uniref:Uncharacterized protein n=1 Tax=Cannabis sativa TaxID=3483 RepID=A0A7J6HVD1_CANSA|nr:hypothetical protein G4B88_022350 [Cannabis sativa]